MLFFLADEHIPILSIRLLEEAGHDVVSIGIDFQSVSDKEIIEIANLEKRYIVTCDSDFGELIFKDGVYCKKGVIYFRIKKFTPEEPANIILSRLDKNQNIFDGQFTVLTRITIRQKPL